MNSHLLLKKKIFLALAFGLLIVVNYSSAQVNFNQQLANRLDSIINKTNNKKYVRTKESDAAVVRGVQEFLVQAEYLPKTKSNGKSSVDGSYGSMTKEAVRKFQIRNNLQADGIIGPQTAAAMRRSPVAAPIQQQVSQEVAKSGAVQDDYFPPYESSGLSFSKANINGNDVPVMYSPESGNQEPSSKFQGRLGDRPSTSLGQDLASGNPSITGGTPKPENDPFVNQGTWEQVSNAAKRFYSDTVDKISDFITTKKDDSSGQDFASQSALKQDSVKDYLKDMSESGMNKDFIDKVESKINDTCGSASGDTGCFDKAVLDTAKDNPGLFYEDEVAANKFLNDKEMQKAKDALDDSKKALAELSGGENPETGSIDGGEEKAKDQASSDKDKLAEHGNVNSILNCTDGHTLAEATPNKPQKIEDKKPTRFLLTTTAAQKPRVLQELVPKAKIGCYLESADDFNGPGGRYCCIETNKEGLCTKTFKNKSEASGFFKTDRSLCQKDGVKQKMVESIDIPVNK